MFWYVFICVVITLIYVVWNTTHKKKRWGGTCIFLVYAVLWFFSALRDESVGADTIQYLSMFDQIREFTISDLFEKVVLDWTYSYVTNWEFFFKLIIWIYLKIFGFISTRSGLAFLSFCILCLLKKAITEQIKFVFLGTWLYVTLGFFQTGLNLTQNALAIMVILWGIRYINETTPKKWILIILVATLIHYSSVVFFPIYWLSKIKFNWKRGLEGVVILIGIALFSRRMLDALFPIIPYRYKVYLRTGAATGGQLMVLFVHIVLVLVTWCFFIRKKSSSDYNSTSESREVSLFVSPYFAFFVCEIICYIFAITSTGMLRVATLFSPAIVLYIPKMIEQMESVKKRRKCLVSIYLISFLSYVSRMILDNIGRTQPYSFFWR